MLSNINTIDTNIAIYHEPNGPAVSGRTALYYRNMESLQGDWKYYIIEC
jgi:hypothetical protein